MTTSTLPQLGFIGLGSMGAHMARRLLEAGYPVVVHDVRDDAVASAVELGATSATSPRAVADAAEVVCLSLPRPADVEAVVLGPDGVVEGDRVEVLVDFSTTGPDMTRRIAATLAASGRAAVDAPVSGGPRGAEHGTLCIMAAGARETFERVAPVLAVLGQAVVHLGEQAGQGQTMKVINNTVSASCLTASCEGLALGAKAGLDSRAMIDVLNASTARNTHTEDKLPRCVLTGGFDFGFQLALMLKDIRLCLDTARDLEVPMMLASAMQQLVALQVAEGGDGQDITEIMRLVEGWAGVEVRDHETRPTGVRVGS